MKTEREVEINGRILENGKGEKLRTQRERKKKKEKEERRREKDLNSLR